MYKGVSANVDFYSGFRVRVCLGSAGGAVHPVCLRVARIVGWSAHRMEELIDAWIRSSVRHTYNVLAPSVYVPLAER